MSFSMLFGTVRELSHCFGVVSYRLVVGKDGLES